MGGDRLFRLRVEQYGSCRLVLFHYAAYHSKSRWFLSPTREQTTGRGGKNCVKHGTPYRRRAVSCCMDNIRLRSILRSPGSSTVAKPFVLFLCVARVSSVSRVPDVHCMLLGKETKTSDGENKEGGPLLAEP